MYLLIVATVVIIGFGLDISWQLIQGSNEENELQTKYAQLISDKVDSKSLQALKAYKSNSSQAETNDFELIEDTSPMGQALIEQMDEHEIIWVQNEDDNFAFKALKNHPYIIKISYPRSKDLSTLKYALVILFYSLIALVIYFWFRPLSSDLNKLEKAVKEFDNHQWQSKVSLPPTSSIKHLASAYNGLLDKIKLLVETQQSMSHAISHELRTPLARVRFSLQMAQESKDIKAIKMQLESIEDDVAEMNDLISELLNFAALENTTKLASQEKGNLKELVKNVIKRLKIDSSKFVISINSKLTNNIAKCDNYLMERAIQNLLVNAAKFAHSNISIALWEDNNQYHISVSDDGPGIPEENRNKVFESFVQLNDKNKSQGFGLGLAIVKRVMLLHQGMAKVTHSELGGAQFILNWPINRES